MYLAVVFPTFQPVLSNLGEEQPDAAQGAQNLEQLLSETKLSQTILSTCNLFVQKFDLSPQTAICQAGVDAVDAGADVAVS